MNNRELLEELVKRDRDLDVSPEGIIKPNMTSINKASCYL